MRRLSILILLLFLTLTVVANPITQRQAMEKAKSFAKLHMKIPNGNLNLAYRTHQDTENANIYIYNVGVNNGYVVVSGDDRMESILGYVDQGAFVYDKMPENMMVWLKNYEECLSILDMQKNKPRQVFQHPTEVVEPMITSKWGQRAPYNSQCPKIYGIQAPTGCTATALAQVMRYHAFPTDSCQTIPSYTVSGADTRPELPPTKFDWDNMPDEITTDSPQECIDAISKLMLYCGHAHDMKYTSSGSGAYTYLIPKRLPIYFGYANTMHYVYRMSYTEQQWDSLLIKELVNNRPIIYTAYNNLAQGHTFICDGYDGNGMYHINWGWNGVGDGYFRISEAFSTDENLSTHIKKYHLSVNQTAILGLQPSGEDDYVAPMEYLYAFSRPSLKNGQHYERASVNSDFTGITIKQWFNNTTSEVKSYSYGLALCDDNDQVIKVLGSKTATIDPETTSKNYYEVQNASFGNGMADGHYTIKAVYKRTSKTSWRVMGGTDLNYIDMVIDGKEMTLTSVPKANFIVNDITKETSFVTIQLENPDEDFFGPIYIRRYNATTDKIEKVASDYIVFDAMSSEDFDIYVEDKLKFDIYNDIYYLSVDEYDTQYFYSSLSTASIDIDKTFEIINHGEEPLSVVGDRIMLRLTLENKSIVEYDNYVTTDLVDEADNTVVQTVSEVVKLGAGEKAEYMYEIPLSDVDYSSEKTYRLRCTHKKDLTSWESDSITPLTIHKGAIYWTKDGEIKTKLAASNFKVPEEALAINLRGGAYTSKVTPNSNPNTIYMLETTLPSGLKGKNYVDVSNKGKNLQLTDSYDYFIPFEMAFSGKVSFTRTINEDDSLRWDAISLPFSPQTVTVDEESTQWYKNEDDEEGSFWLMEFGGISNDSIVSTYAETFQAYTPYLFATSQTLAGKTLSFEANKITLTPTVDIAVEIGDTILHGTHCLVNEPGAFVLSEGSFVYAEEGVDVPAFRAYLTIGTLPGVIPDSLGVSPSLIKPVEPIEDPTFLGDVNDDGIININDVITLVNYIVGQTPSQFAKKNADLDGDGQYSVTDVILLVNILISSPNPSNPSGNDDNPDTPTDDTPTDDNPSDNNSAGEE